MPTLAIDKTIFDFEFDFAGSLRCIPMIVRLKLDLVGVKVSLRQWSRFERAERGVLVDRPCETAAEIWAYRTYVVDLIAQRAGEQAVDLPVEAHPEWADRSQAPARLVAYAIDRNLPPPAPERWAGLTTLQRFALFKLTRSGHDNDNFEPAMREFGLLD